MEILILIVGFCYMYMTLKIANGVIDNNCTVRQHLLMGLIIPFWPIILFVEVVRAVYHNLKVWI